ncbi:flavin reductase family protein [Ancylobacter pratisalsi]|uniref:Flavin reductase family protein n=1 Tax=Ancylobacter pratisalsi TaxID=1745854 RepID=A0A6P1YPL8_9HYPH|nr:flavin reductase family protein [Ancylobacter pratisalsi]
MNSLADAAPGSVDSRRFRQAMRLLAGHVCVITVGDGADSTGFTATSVTALSADGPTLLVSLNKSSSSWSAIEASPCFGVNILAGGHRHVAEAFSGFDGRKGGARYDGARWSHQPSGVWLPEDAMVAFDCALEEVIAHRSHAILIGLVRAVKAYDAQDPLVYWQGSYRRLTDSI